MTVGVVGCVLWVLGTVYYRYSGATWLQAVWFPLEWALRMAWWLVCMAFRLIGVVLAGFAVAAWFHS